MRAYGDDMIELGVVNLKGCQLFLWFGVWNNEDLLRNGCLYD